MSEETKIYNDGLEGEPNEDQNQSEASEMDIGSTAKSGVPGYISLGVGVAAGLGAGIFATHYAYGNVSNQEPEVLEPSPIPADSFFADLLVKADTPVATGITDDMTLDQAYEAAREQIGAGGVFVWGGNVYGTYDEEEWNGLSEDQQNDYYSNFNLKTEETQPDTLIENVDVSSVVNDDMSFGEAFAAAREELKAGGVFMWHGNAYNTFYKEEWADMAQSDKDKFLEDYLDIPDDQLVYDTGDLNVGDVDGDLAVLQGEVVDVNQEDMVDEDVPMAEPVYEYHNPEEVIYEAEPVYTEPSYHVGTELPISGDDQAELEFTLEDFSKVAHDANNIVRAVDQNFDELIPDDLVGGMGVIDDVSNAFSTGQSLFNLFKGDHSIDDQY